MSTADPEMVLAHFIVSSDVVRSRRFYTDVLGGKTVISGEADDEVTYVALANSWIIINVGGGPTDDKPAPQASVAQRRLRSAVNRVSHTEVRVLPGALLLPWSSG